MATAAIAPLTSAEIRKFVIEWYRKLAIHAPLADLTSMLATKGLEMKFPEATLWTAKEFETWYERVIHTYFDEVHNVKDVHSTITDDGAEVEIVIHWEASMWNPPAAKSRRIKLDAYQTWYVVRNPETERPVIVRYTVDKLEYMKDSARL
jgi:hypothetical protein